MDLPKNIEAFLTMLAVSEGTNHLGDRGYNVLVGGKLFKSYADHPRKKVWIKSIQNYSTAAGRYQILERIFDYYKYILNLPDFSPESQDAIAIKILKERRAYQAILDGNIVYAIDRVKNIWASLPEAGYGQHENSLAFLRQKYTEAGGIG